MGYSSWGQKESDMIEVTEHACRRAAMHETDRQQ